MIEVKNLTKKYGNRIVLDDISFFIDTGEVIGFLGPNGAGKSTTMNILTGYLSFSFGMVKIAGHDILEEPILAKKSIGYLPEVPPVYPEMTVEEYLKFICGIKKVSLEKKVHIEEIMEKVGLSDFKKKLIRILSKGYKQRVGLAGALIGNPKILILDEPTVGLDPHQVVEMRKLIEDLKINKTIFFSSHILSEVQSVCSRVLVINEGKIAADSRINELSNEVTNNKIVNVVIEGPKDEVLKLLNSIEHVKRVKLHKKKEPLGIKYSLYSKQIDIRKDLFFSLASKNFPILELKEVSSSLEEIFLKLTKEGQNVNDT